MSETSEQESRDHESPRGRLFYFLCGAAIGYVVGLLPAAFLFSPNAQEVFLWPLAFSFAIGVLAALFGNSVLMDIGNFFASTGDD